MSCSVKHLQPQGKNKFSFYKRYRFYHVYKEYHNTLEFSFVLCVCVVSHSNIYTILTILYRIQMHCQSAQTTALHQIANYPLHISYHHVKRNLFVSLLQVWFSYIYLESELILWVFCEKLDLIFQVKKDSLHNYHFYGQIIIFQTK